MAHKLKTDGKVRYSKGEQKLFKLLSTRKLSSTELVERYYNGNETFNSRKIMIGLLRSLGRKMAANRESFKLLSTDRSGPRAMFFWLGSK
jgi:hypothetical protein